MSIQKLQHAKIGENFDSYAKMVAELTKETARDAILLLASNNDNEECFRNLLSSVITKISGFTSDSSELTDALPYILSSIRPLENPISILFQLLENFSQKRDEIARLKVLEMLSRFEFSAANVVSLLYKSDTDAVVCDILRMKESLIDDFIRSSIKLDNHTVAKNLSAILPSLPPRVFVNYNSFLFLFESENHCMRNCLLDILQALALSFKEHENIEAIRDVTRHISERFGDVNFYVRSKAITVIGELFRMECILKDQRNALIGEIMERAKDKTVIVRKKSVGLLAQILMNHPFRDRADLSRDAAEPKAQTETQRRIREDFNAFVELMESCLGLVVSLLEYNFKTDLVEIAAFIKGSYLLRLRGAKEAVQKMLGVVFTRDKQVVIDVFKEILSQRAEILYEFINDKAFETILGHLEVDEKALYRNVLSGHRVFEGMYILKQVQKPISENNALALLQHVTDLLFRSRDENEVRANIETYVNMLCVLKGLKRRVDNSGELLTLCVKNAIKMVFFERSVIKHTVELIYYTSNSPEITVCKLLKSLCLTKSTLKIVDAIGWVALNEYYLLERLERVLRADKGAAERLSMMSRREESESFREKRKSLEDSRRASLSNMSFEKPRQSLSGRLSLRFEELEESLRSKTDEEIADFFFYLKEKEVLYSKNSMLHQFIPLMVESLSSSNMEVQAVAHSSLFKCMQTSSEFFNEHKGVLLSALSSPFAPVRNHAIAAFHDFLIFYSTSLDPSLLFEKLRDREVAKNALLAIYSLLHKNILRPKGNAVNLVSFLFDDELGPIVKTLVKSFSANNNAISVIFYETFMSSLGVDCVRFLASLISASIQESLFMKCLNNCTDPERLRAVYESFEISEKFIKENLFRDELRVLVEKK